MGGGNNSNNNPNNSQKQRLSWTDELHQKFVDAVSKLGGPDRSTPKGVLKMMGVEGLTVYHVKSHLQKYRVAKSHSDPSFDDKKSDDKESKEMMIAGIDGSSGMQVTDALQLQMELQMRLHEQLELQKQLQLRMDAQGKYLKKTIEEQRHLIGVFPQAPGVGSVDSPLTPDREPTNLNCHGTSPLTNSDSPDILVDVDVDVDDDMPQTPDFYRTNIFNMEIENSNKKQRLNTTTSASSEIHRHMNMIVDNYTPAPFGSTAAVSFTRNY